MIFNIFHKKKENKNKIIFLILIIIFLFSFVIFLLVQNSKLNNKLESYFYEKEKIKIDRTYFNSNIELKKYDKTRYQITNEWKTIIENIRNVHKSPVLISEEYQNKELCAWYIWNLSEKIWWKRANYSIWMQNQKKWKPAQAWELPYFYDAFGWEVLIDLWNKFTLKDKNFVEKVNIEDIKDFFAKAFSEKSLFWDIWFLYSKTKYTDFLKSWSRNSHITKNMWISDFEIIFSKIDESKSTVQNIINNFSCSSNFEKYIDILENYEFYLNGKKIIFYKKDFYYLNNDNSIWEKIKLKYLDKITYKDITLAHFFESKSRVDSLLLFSCSLKFYPINIISINSRMIEKM